MTEYRDGTGGGCPRLIPGCVHAQVCVTAPGSVPVLDCQLDQANGIGSTRFTVGVEDGRQFLRCLLANLRADGVGAKRRYVYCLGCEAVTTPPPQ